MRYMTPNHPAAGNAGFRCVSEPKATAPACQSRADAGASTIMKFCCDRFELAYKQRHGRGIFVYVLPPTPSFPTQPLFQIGMRALEPTKVLELQEAAKGQMTGSLSLSGGTAIGYCPWCGAVLAEFYRDAWPQLLDERITDELGLPTA